MRSKVRSSRWNILCTSKQSSSYSYLYLFIYSWTYELKNEFLYFIYLFIHFICVLRLTQEYFTYMTAATLCWRESARWKPTAIRWLREGLYLVYIKSFQLKIIASRPILYLSHPVLQSYQSYPFGSEGVGIVYIID